VNFADIPLLSILKGKLGYLSQRQSVIAQNVANADTPGYVPRDLTAFSFDKIMSGDFGAGLFPAGGASGAPITGPIVMAPVRTNAMHIAADTGSAAASAYPNQIKEDSEVRLDGNHVVLEDQMVKLSAARMDYDAAVGFYQKSMALLTTALKKPGT
jgi:flagellar basal-body rod protein FlgB